MALPLACGGGGGGSAPTSPAPPPPADTPTPCGWPSETCTFTPTFTPTHSLTPTLTGTSTSTRTVTSTFTVTATWTVTRTPTHTASTTCVAVFPDAGLRNAAHALMGSTPPVPIYCTPIAGENSLNAPSSNISDLTGLNYMPNLTTLTLNSNLLTDIGPVSFLTQLQTLDLDDNQIAVLTPVAGLTNLTFLRASNNQVTSLAALQNLTQLNEIVMDHNQIPNLAPLVANTGLGSGDSVDVTANPLTDTAFFEEIPTLTERGVVVNYDPPTETPVPTDTEVPTETPTDTEPPAETPTVTATSTATATVTTSPRVAVTFTDPNFEAGVRYSLAIPSPTPIMEDELQAAHQILANDRTVTDLGGLEHGNGIHQLYIQNNLLEDPDWDPITHVTSLTHLNITNNQFTTLAPITPLVNLLGLECGMNDISSLEPLSSLTLLELVNASSNTITSLAPLVGLTHLQEIAVNVNNITSVPNLSSSSALTFLSIRANPIPSLSGIGTPPLLWKIDGNSMKLTSLDGIEGISTLRVLSFDGNDLTDISALSGLPNLETIDLQNNELTGVDALLSNTNLANRSVTVDVRFNPLDADAHFRAIPTLEARNITVLRDASPTMTPTSTDTPTSTSTPTNTPTFTVTDTPTITLTPTITHTRMIVDFQDNNLEAAVRETVGIPTQTPVYNTDLNGHTTFFHVAPPQIQSLWGMEYWTDLEEVSLAGENFIASTYYSPFIPTHLRALTITGSGVVDLISFPYFPWLETMVLTNNAISDLTPLGTPGPWTYADLRGNLFPSIQPLIDNAAAGGLGSGDTVDLSDNAAFSAQTAAPTQVHQLREYGVTVRWETPTPTSTPE